MTISIGLTMSVELATLTGISVFVSVDFCQQKFERKITNLSIFENFSKNFYLVVLLGVQLEALGSERFAGIGLSILVSSGSVFESLNKSFHTLVPFVAVLSAVEGAER